MKKMMAMANQGIMKLIKSTTVRESRTVNPATVAISALTTMASPMIFVFCSMANMKAQTSRKGNIKSTTPNSPKSSGVAIYLLPPISSMMLPTLFQAFLALAPKLPCPGSLTISQTITPKISRITINSVTSGLHQEKTS